MQNLEGKVAFITGGGSGVAFGQARVFAEEAGMKVVIADIRQDHLDQAMAHFKQKNVPVHAIKLDITDRDRLCDARADEAEKVFGPVDLLCNTAGVSQFGPLEQATYDDWDWQIDVNLKGMINGVMTFMPRMIERKTGGHIVNTASMSAFVALPRTADLLHHEICGARLFGMSAARARKIRHRRFDPVPRRGQHQHP